MQKPDDAGRAAPLVIELASGTAKLHGEELELPFKEFKLLAALATRRGEPIPSQDLIEIVWPEAPWTSTTELYTHISRLRRQIDGHEKFGNNIRNRRGYGYVLDLEPDQLVVIDPAPVQPTPLTIDLTETAPEGSVQDPVVPRPAELEESQPPIRRRTYRALPAAALALALIAASWGTGYVLSNRNEADPGSAGRQVADNPEPLAPKADGVLKPQQRDVGRTGRTRKHRKPRQRSVGGSAVAAPITAQGSSEPAADSSNSSQGSRKGSQGGQPPAPALPPAPTRYLYHLVNPETGDHFVTTDPATASEQEARGYEGGPIGRVYTSREDSTKAITTNGGTAYIFIGGTPKTEPASSTVALWYSTNNDGDFFYTTNESQAKQSGWTGSIIGYVRAL